VALIDLDLQFGDVGSVLDLKSANSIADLLAQPEITQELVNDTFVKHTSGVRVLLAPENLSVVETIDPADAVALLKKLTALCRLRRVRPLVEPGGAVSPDDACR